MMTRPTATDGIKNIKNAIMGEEALGTGGKDTNALTEKMSTGANNNKDKKKF